MPPKQVTENMLALSNLSVNMKIYKFFQLSY